MRAGAPCTSSFEVLGDALWRSRNNFTAQLRNGRENAMEANQM